MRFINDLSVKLKMVAGFGSIMFVSAVFAFFMVSTFSEFSADLSSVGSLQKELSVSKDFQINSINVWQYVTDASLTKEKSSMEKAGEYVVKAKTDLDRLIAIRKESSGDLSELETIKEEIDRMYNKGREMFEAYLISPEEGNLKMTEFDEVCSKLIARANNLAKQTEVNAAKAGVEMNEMVSSGISTSLFFIVFATIISVGITILVIRWLMRVVKRLTKASEKLALGDMSVIIEANSKDEFGNLQRSFGVMIANIKEQAIAAERIAQGDTTLHLKAKSEHDILSQSIMKVVETIRGLVSETVSLSKNAVEGKLSTRGKAEVFQGGFREIIAGFNSTLDAVVEPINESSILLEKLSKGDLTVRMEGEYKGDYSKIKNSINGLADSFNRALSDVAEAVSATASASNEISSSTEQMAAGAQEQSSQTSEVASAVEQMTKTIIETTRNSGQASDAAKNSGAIAKEGGRVVEETIVGMNRVAEVVKRSADMVETLGRSSDQIGEIVQVIDDIADQTNLLALNAAIEAARAGEQGRGFAVVADEVRKLAERTTKATKEIATMIRQIQKDTEGAVHSMKEGTVEVEKGKLLADKAGQSLKQIITGAQEVVDISTQVAAASEEQSSAAEQISRNIESISNVTNESAAGVQQIARAAEDLNRLTINLQELVSRFKIDESSSDRSNGNGKSHIARSQVAVRSNGKLIHS